MDAVVIGVGNRWRRDDAAGLAVLAGLRGRVGDDVSLIASDGEPTRLLDAFERSDRVVMVDAVVTGAVPGTVHRFTDTELPSQMGIGQSSHLVQLVETISLGRLLGRLPNGLVLIGIEATEDDEDFDEDFEDFDNGEEMTGPVAGAIERAVAAVLNELEP